MPYHIKDPEDLLAFSTDISLTLGKDIWTLNSMLQVSFKYSYSSFLSEGITFTLIFCNILTLK